MENGMYFVHQHPAMDETISNEQCRKIAIKDWIIAASNEIGPEKQKGKAIWITNSKEIAEEIGRIRGITKQESEEATEKEL